MDARFILNKKVLTGQVKKLTDLNLKVCYSYKTNREVGNLLQKSACQGKDDIGDRDEGKSGHVSMGPVSLYLTKSRLLPSGA